MPINDGLKIDIRRNKILDILRKDGQVRTSVLSKILDTSAVTIRSDLAALEQAGYLKRIQGGAIQTIGNLYHQDFQIRIKDKIDLKKKIAERASEIINDGETLLINAGSTTLLTAIELRKHKNLNIVTNSMAVALELDSYPSFRVILLGGEINAQYGFTYGADAQEQLRKYKADKAILSIDGISTETGLTTYHAEEATIVCLMMDRSRETIIVADSSKFGQESFSHFANIDRADYWVTDDNLDEEVVQPIEQLGIKVIRTE